MGRRPRRLGARRRLWPQLGIERLARGYPRVGAQTSDPPRSKGERTEGSASRRMLTKHVVSQWDARKGKGGEYRGRFERQDAEVWGTGGFLPSTGA